MIRHRCLRPLIGALAVIATLALVTADADARAGGGSSFGSRGTRSYSAPPPTSTAPTTAAPLQRSQAQPSNPSASTSGNLFNRPGGFFNRPGLLGGLAAGFLGAGLLGMLFGNGLFGGLGGLASIFGLLLQVGLVVVVARLAWSWWQRRNGNAPAFAGASFLRGASPSAEPPAAYGGGQPGNGQSAGFGSAPVNVDKADFDAFERLLGEVQVAYGAEDLNALRARVTPEMVSYFSEELAANASRGVVNKVGQPKLLQGDLAEAWREGDSEYATVAMRYALTDTHVDRASGRVVEGDPERPVEVTEVWTFRRVNGGAWLLSAIQQA